MSVNKVNKTTGDLSLLAGANNITNTTGVAELSALANLGTAANATQHEVNVAINEAINKSVKPITNVSSFQSNDLIGAKLVCITCYMYNSPGGYYKTSNVIAEGGSQFLTVYNPLANERGFREISLDNSTGTLTFGVGYNISNNAFIEDNNWCYPVSYSVLS